MKLLAVLSPTMKRFKDWLHEMEQSTNPAEHPVAYSSLMLKGELQSGQVFKAFIINRYADIEWMAGYEFSEVIDLGVMPSAVSFASSRVR